MCPLKKAVNVLPKVPDDVRNCLLVTTGWHQKWETDFYTPPVLGGAALLPFSAPAVYKNQGP